MPSAPIPESEQLRLAALYRYQILDTHPEAAYEFINFILRPDVIAEITNSIYYGNDNIASRPLVDKHILDDVNLYPTPEIEKRLYRSAEVSAATERIRTRTWTRIKTAK